jgi:AcrR family transcriptional regulator
VAVGAKQERARETIAAVLDVTRDLLEEQGEQGVRLDEVQRRSGVSSGSIYHHFGDRDGLIAAAQVDRFDRVVRDDAAGLVDTLFGAATRGDPNIYLEAVRRQSATVVLPERTRIRWARVTALSSAWQRRDLFTALGASFSVLIDALTEGARRLQSLGVMHDGLDPRAVAIFSQIHSLGLLLNDLDPDPVTNEEWVGLMQHMMVSLSPTLHGLPAQDLERLAEVTEERRQQAQVEVEGFEFPRRRAPAEGRTRNDERFDAIIDLAAAAMRRGGAAEVRIDDIRTAVGVSAGWFHRRFGDRDGLLDVTRIVLFTRLVEGDVALLESLVEQASDPMQFAEALRRALLFAGANDELSASRWHRVEALAASVGSPALRHELGRTIGELGDRVEQVVRRAQEKGLLQPDLPARSLAHFLSSYPFGFLFVELDAGRVGLEEWAALLTRILASLQPAPA